MSDRSAPRAESDRSIQLEEFRDENRSYVAGWPPRLRCRRHASAQGVTDAQIASIVVTANQVDIDAGKLAAASGTNAEVKKFGEQMVTDHTGVNKSAVELVTKLKVTPEDNATSKSLKAGGEKNVATPEDAQGRGVRQGLRRPRGRVSPAGARRGRQDADPRRQQRRAQGAAGQGPAGVRRAPRARQDDPGVAREGHVTMVAGTASRIGVSCLGLLLLSCSGSNPVPPSPRRRRPTPSSSKACASSRKT